MPDSEQDVEELKKEYIEKIVDQKVEEKTQKLEKKNRQLKKLQHEVQKLKTGSNTIEPTSSQKSGGISRREFLKKAGFGTLGLGALLSPVSALNVRSDSFSVYTGEDSGDLEHSLEVGPNGSVKIPGSNLEVQNGNLGIGTTDPSLPLEIHDTTGIKIPVGTSDERSNSPQQGELRFNSENKTEEVYFDGEWKVIGSIFEPIDAEGGDDVYVFTDSTGRDWRVHAFTDTGSFEFEILDAGSNGEIEVLVVGGGGSGGHRRGGGGGAGGVLYGTESISQNSYSIEVGEGTSRTPFNSGNRYRGEDSSAFGMVAEGGGYGGASFDSTHPPSDGGSGGGGTADHGGVGSGISSQGRDGGDSNSGGNNTDDVAGGGGGAGSPGKDAEGDKPGDGGDGQYFGEEFGEKHGEDGWFGGGGGGSFNNNDDRIDPGKGGKGGGGRGAYGTDEDGGNPELPFEDRAFNGTPNTGGGGGGNASNPDADYDGHNDGGAGGSGIVMIRYPLER